MTKIPSGSLKVGDIFVQGIYGGPVFRVTGIQGYSPTFELYCDHPDEKAGWHHNYRPKNLLPREVFRLDRIEIWGHEGHERPIPTPTKASGQTGE